jgi:hypothetical protein
MGGIFDVARIAVADGSESWDWVTIESAIPVVAIFDLDQIAPQNDQLSQRDIRNRIGPGLEEPQSCHE